MRRAPEILSLSIHDARGNALWSSGDFLLAEDHALIAEVVEDPHDVRGRNGGLWWESADTARARCALAVFEGAEFRGVTLVVFSGLTTYEDDRVERVAELAPVLPVLAKALRMLKTDEPEAAMPPAARRIATPRSSRRCVSKASARTTNSRQDLATLEREEQLLGAHRHGAARGRIRAAPAAHRFAAR